MSTTTRKQGVARLLIGIPYVILAVFLIFPFVIFLAVITAILDITAAIVLSRTPFETTKRLWKLHRRVWRWNLGNIEYIIEGGSARSFELTP